MVDLTTELGPIDLRSPLVAASGTIGSVVDVSSVGALEAYGAATAKSVSEEPWPGRQVPRMAPAGVGMLNGIGIQNPGVTAWVETVGPSLATVAVPVWGSAVGTTPGEFARVAVGLQGGGVTAIEINLSCPNLDTGSMFALDPVLSAEVVSAVREAVDLPIGAKLSPNAASITEVATAVVDAGADWLVLTNTVLGMAIDVEARRPVLSGGVGGYSGPPIKPIALRCVWEVHRALPDVPIVGCGGVTHGEDVVEYMMAGASAVALGTVHFAEPRAGRRVLGEVVKWCRRHGVERVRDLKGAASQR